MNIWERRLLWSHMIRRWQAIAAGWSCWKMVWYWKIWRTVGIRRHFIRRFLRKWKSC